MNPLLLFCLLTSALAAAGPGLTVHEWGTFTTVNGSDGRQLPGLEIEEENLPNFVHGIAGFAPANKGWARPVRGVTVKMETPVIYFYAGQPCSVRVAVGFNGGSISQWYPDRTDGESMPAPPVEWANGRPVRETPAVDFAAGYQGRATWQVDVLARDAADPISAPRELETRQWPRARVPGANRVRGPKGEVEGFVFYRGLGRFEPPLRVSCDKTGRVRLENTGGERIPFVFLLDRRANFPDGMVWWHGSLAPGESHTELTRQSYRGGPAAGIREKVFPAALIAAGLTPDEARAMLDTWRESYFERPGLRVFWIVPRAFTDRVLPMTITPRPANLQRVLVGRSEVLTPAFEAELVRGFAANGGRRWTGDRFFRAYAERARQLGVALPQVNP